MADIELLLVRNDKGSNDACDPRRGDIVHVLEVPATWGRREDPRSGFFADPADCPFVLLQVTGCPYTAAEALAKWTVVDYDNPDTENKTIVRRRKWRVIVDSAPTGVKNKLSRDGFTSINWNQIKSLVENKRTQETE
jgi:hypothetical protein